MQHVSRNTEEFLSDDKRISVSLEIIDGKVSSVVLAKKNGPKVEFLPGDLAGLTEVLMGAHTHIVTTSNQAVG